MRKDLANQKRSRTVTFDNDSICNRFSFRFYHQKWTNLFDKERLKTVRILWSLLTIKYHLFLTIWSNDYFHVYLLVFSFYLLIYFILKFLESDLHFMSVSNHGFTVESTVKLIRE